MTLIPAVGAVVRAGGQWLRVTNVTEQQFRRHTTFTIDAEPFVFEPIGADDTPAHGYGVPFVEPTPARLITTISEPAVAPPPAPVRADAAYLTSELSFDGIIAAAIEEPVKGRGIRHGRRKEKRPRGK